MPVPPAADGVLPGRPSRHCRIPVVATPSMIWRFNRLSPVGVPATLVLSPFIPVLLWRSLSFAGTEEEEAEE